MSNDHLDSILSNAKSASSASATNFIGQTVTADGKNAQLQNGSATWNLNPARAAAKATNTITDSEGNVVGTQTKTLNAGAQTFTWDGRNSAGLTSPDGQYAITVNAVDTTG